MKIKLTEDGPIKGKLCKAGDAVIVTKDLGERMIEEGVANRIIDEPENRMRVIRYSGHRKIYSDGSDGRKYVKKGDGYVELKG